MPVFGRLDRLTLRLLLSQAADLATFAWFYLFVGSRCTPSATRSSSA